jgi:rod shape determining protein RodA
MVRNRTIRDLDWPLLVITLIISAIGILQIYSATHETKWRDAWWKQIIFVLVGIVLMWIISSVDYHTLLGQVPLMYVGGVVLLGVTLAFGTMFFGSRRWIPLMGFTFQVSEFVKLVIVLLMARFLAETKAKHLQLRDLLKLGGLVGIPALLVFKQPDLGTALTYAPILGIGVLLAGLKWQHSAAILALVAVTLPASWFVLSDYQRARLTTFIDPSRDPRGEGYQVIQSKIAVGHGGMWGRGVTQGTQTQLNFLPVPHTDFIFSAYAEEHGFLGVVFVLAMYFLLLMQIVQNAQMAPDRAGMYICMGVAALFLFHILVNVGMVVGRMPITGIPLPLMSAGGSHVLTVFLMLGLVNNVRLRRFVN